MKVKIDIKKILKNQINYVISFFLFLFFLLFSFTKLEEAGENALYDLALHIKPEVKERSEVLLLNVDDLAIEKVGSWPWTRDVLADVLIRFKELGGKMAVFDIEYLSPSLRAINKEYIEETLPKEYQDVREEMGEYIKSFSAAIKNESIPLQDVEVEGNNMSEYLDEKVASLSDSLSRKVFKDNDEYFSHAIKFFGNTFLTINAVDINIGEEAKEVKDYAWKNLLLSNVEDKDGLIKEETLKEKSRLKEAYGIAPAILPLIQKARGAGFPNVVIDGDGVRRRIPLLREYNGRYVAQLIFAPLISMLSPTKIIRDGQNIILKDANIDGEKKDITIPLDEGGNLLINWLKKKFVDAEHPENSSFKSLSCYALLYADLLEKALVSSINDIASLDIRGDEGHLSYYREAMYLKDFYEKLNSFKTKLLQDEDDAQDEYFKERSSFFASINDFLDGNAKSELESLLDRAIEAENDASYKDAYKTAKDNVELLFGNTRTFYKQYVEHVEQVSKICKGAFAIIGYSGVGTSDLGTNPFINSYPNVGTHANVYNTIMSGEFIREIPKVWSLILSFILAILSAWAIKKIQKVYVKIVFGTSLTIALFTFFIAMFALFNIYLPIFTPLLMVASSFILLSFLSFILTEKEKSFLRRAFAVYLSDDVVKQIVKDPSYLALGGVAKRITALFTDIKSFSTLSEKISPEHLVSVLNIYLTRMSDIILEEKGTIDKYIGDAIVSFFGAPLDVVDHAKRSCYAALRMKEAEEEINATLYNSGKIPMPINTRIGINTGEMVVGNMGTEKKMNYTIMGNDVNLAARLEGVNKKYGTWILISESTWNETDGVFLGRRLDRVRVVGINTPVQLYNLMAVKKEASNQMLSLVEQFEKGISLYRERQYSEALLAFRECQKIKADDEPTKIYIERMEELCSDAQKAKDHDDVVNMTSK